MGYWVTSTGVTAPELFVALTSATMLGAIYTNSVPSELSTTLPTPALSLNIVIAVADNIDDDPPPPQPEIKTIIEI
jgi:hypothetical protein